MNSGSKILAFTLSQQSVIAHSILTLHSPISVIAHSILTLHSPISVIAHSILTLHSPIPVIAHSILTLQSPIPVIAHSILTLHSPIPVIAHSILTLQSPISVFLFNSKYQSNLPHCCHGELLIVSLQITVLLSPSLYSFIYLNRTYIKTIRNYFINFNQKVNLF